MYRCGYNNITGKYETEKLFTIQCSHWGEPEQASHTCTYVMYMHVFCLSVYLLVHTYVNNTIIYKCNANLWSTYFQLLVGVLKTCFVNYCFYQQTLCDKIHNTYVGN